MKKIQLLVILLISLQSYSQKFTISGNIIDKKNGETIIGCNVYTTLNDKPVGTTTNEYGFFSLSLPKGKYKIVASYIGYANQMYEIDLDNNQKLNISLVDDNVLKEVVVRSKKNDVVRSNVIGIEKINMVEIAKLPVLFGEKDVLKTIQLLPGVKSSGEGNSGFSVRGGGFDQNLILLDEAPVYNASHLLGFFSTFNSDAIKSATLIKGNAPAQYGGRLSSILDVKMKDGNNQNTEVSGGIGLISSRLNIEAPLQKGKSSFLISGRRTYADMFLKASESFKDNTLYFYDLNLKANYEINNNNRLFLSGYFGRDNLGLGDAFGINFGNKTGTLRWNSIINPKLFLNTSLIVSNYTYIINVSSGGNKESNSKILDYNLKQDYQWNQSAISNFKFGFNSILHTITPSNFTGEGTNQDERFKGDRYGFENAVYVSREHKINTNFSMDYGLRFSSYSLVGTGIYNTYNGDNITNSTTLSKGQFGKTYYNLEPKLLTNYLLNDNSSIKAAYSRNTQNVHLLSESNAGNPTDQWIGNSYNVKPEISDQFSAGYFRKLKENNYELAVEGYYKNLQNQVDYKNGAKTLSAVDIESELLFGSGRAYGLEFIMKKKTGNLSGWISYTLSKTERKIDGINNNEWYNAKQDRTHDLSIVGTYDYSKKWTFSALFVFYTGNAVTFPSGKYTIDNVTTFYYNGRNQDRMPNYHRLDLSATLNLMPKGKYTSNLNFSLYNAYGRENAYSINFEDNPNDASKTRAVQTALFKWVPSVTYNFKF
jgi:hypothetical protein